MIPRKKLDIGWSDLLFGVKSCVLQGNHQDVEQRIAAVWSPDSHVAVSLSVRSGFDALLQALALPVGSEVLVSAITIRDMTRIIEQHGLIPVPVDLNMETLAVDMDCLERAVTPKTRAVLVAHLFGSRMPMEPLIRFARQHGLFVIEDCAQAYVGAAYTGHPQSDVRMFSFGPIKTNTALGGGILCFKDPSVCDKVNAVQSRYPLQPRRQFLQRLGKYALLKLLNYTLPFTILVVLCRLFGTNHDSLISKAVRGFAGTNLFTKIRQQPSYPLLALLERRLKNFDSSALEARIKVAQAAINLLPTVQQPGVRATYHSHWVFPIYAHSPERLMQHLWRAGFDATRHGSSLCVVDPPADRPTERPTEAISSLQHILYLPIYRGVSPRRLKRLAQVIAEFDTAQHASLKEVSVNE
jgi:perosamine synthetase